MKREGLPVSIVRPTFVYGPRAVYTAKSFVLLPSLLARYMGSVPLPTGGPRINTIHVEDMAAATVAVLEAGETSAGKAYNVTDKSEMSACRFLATVFEPFRIIVSREMPVPWAVVEVVARLLERLQLAAFRAIDGFLPRRWDRVIIENDLVPLLTPRLDRDFAGFLYGEHYYSNGRVKALGWEPRYRTFADGWLPTVEWYRENAYIP